MFRCFDVLSFTRFETESTLLFFTTTLAQGLTPRLAPQLARPSLERAPKVGPVGSDDPPRATPNPTIALLFPSA